MSKEMQAFRAKCRKKAIESLALEPEENISAVFAEAYIEGFIEGVMKGYCWCIVNGFGPLDKMAEVTGCPEQELRIRMHKYFPDFEC